MLLKSLQFWKAVAYLVAAVVLIYAPDFPINDAAVLAFLLGILKLFDVIPSVK